MIILFGLPFLILYLLFWLLVAGVYVAVWTALIVLGVVYVILRGLIGLGAILVRKLKARSR